MVSEIGQGRAGQGRAGQGRAGQGRAGQGGQGLPVPYTSHKNTFWINKNCKELPACAGYNALLHPVL